MRQVNGQTPQPVADNIINLKIPYDLCDGTNGPNCSDVPNALAAVLPNKIHKVNIQVIAQTLTVLRKQIPEHILATSREHALLSFKDRYQ